MVQTLTYHFKNDKFYLKEGTEMKQLFDKYGRRTPFHGMRVYNQISRRYFQTNQPEIDFTEIHSRIMRFGGIESSVSAKTFEKICQEMLNDLATDSEVASILNGIHLPFICPALPESTEINKEMLELAEAVQNSFKDKFPEYDFYHLAKKHLEQNGEVEVAQSSRYERFEEARRNGSVVGWYFPTCLAEYDIDSQREQTESLPPQFVLSGMAEASMALVGCPDLLLNKETYPHHLCLTALKDADERFFYCFEAYGYNLVFNRRTNVLIPGVKQLSEQFAGGLTVFTTLT
jgi:hypothetical protein